MTRRLQQLQPLLPSWKMGAPGWYVHNSAARSKLSSNWRPHALRLHVVPGEGMTERSSASSTYAVDCGLATSASAGAGVGGMGVGAAGKEGGQPYDSVAPATAVGAGAGAEGLGAGRVGFSSEWVPVAQPSGQPGQHSARGAVGAVSSRPRRWEAWQLGVSKPASRKGGDAHLGWPRTRQSCRPSCRSTTSFGGPHGKLGRVIKRWTKVSWFVLTQLSGLTRAD